MNFCVLVCELWPRLTVPGFLLPFLLLPTAQTRGGVVEEEVGFLLINLSHQGQFGY